MVSYCNAVRACSRDFSKGEKCIGCNACVIVCPFGIIKTAPIDNYLSKCDLCIERLEEGKIPACAASCPTNAIRFTNIADLSEDRRKEVVQKFKASMVQSGELKE